jgi:FtsP/CotA-like multicopper oxidase with cupredoxin domain
MKRLVKTLSVAGVTLALCGTVASASFLVPQVPLDPSTIPKYVEPLPDPEKLSKSRLRIEMGELDAQILPARDAAGDPTGFGATRVWGYAKSYPGPTIEAQRHRPTTVTWSNKIDFRRSLVQDLVTVDQTLHWADPLGLGCMEDPTQPACFEPYQGPVPGVAHLHGGETPSAYDGGPDAWYTRPAPKLGPLKGPGYVTNRFTYPNAQEAATLWYHDHALGSTRTNVYSGLAGFYLLRDWENEPANLPGGPADCTAGRGDDDDRGARGRKGRDAPCPYEREIVIQDRLFDTNSQLYFPDGSSPDDEKQPPSSEVHPFWIPEFVGNTIVVNGKSWPYLEVEARRYRFRLLDGSNARPYRLRIENPSTGEVLDIWQIGTDGGLLNEPVKVVDPPNGPGLVIAPGERADIIVDFAGLEGQTLRMLNNLAPPFGDVDPNTTGQIIELRVVKARGRDRSFDPEEDGAVLRSAEDRIPSLDPAVTGAEPDAQRLLTLNGIPAAPGRPLAILLNNSTWVGLNEAGVPIPGSERIAGADDPRLPFTTELPRVGATEIWRFANLTAGGHPLHLHLIQFQVLDRTPFDAACYREIYNAEFDGGTFVPFDGPPNLYGEENADGEIGGNPAVPAHCITGPSRPPAPWERGWKDTGRAPPSFISRFAVRFAPTDSPTTGAPLCPAGNVLLEHPDALPCVPQAGSNLFPFDPTAGLDVRKDAFGYPGGPGYVWHCHILDHEDNEMMRAMFMKP